MSSSVLYTAWAQIFYSKVLSLSFFFFKQRISAGERSWMSALEPNSSPTRYQQLLLKLIRVYLYHARERTWALETCQHASTLIWRECLQWRKEFSHHGQFKWPLANFGGRLCSVTIWPQKHFISNRSVNSCHKGTSFSDNSFDADSNVEVRGSMSIIGLLKHLVPLFLESLCGLSRAQILHLFPCHFVNSGTMMPSDSATLNTHSEALNKPAQ